MVFFLVYLYINIAKCFFFFHFFLKSYCRLHWRMFYCTEGCVEVRACGGQKPVSVFVLSETSVQCSKTLTRNERRRKHVAILIYRNTKKNPTYRIQRISQPMRIVGPIQFWRGCVIYFKKKRKKSTWNDSLFLRLYKLVHKCTSSRVEHLPCVDLPRVQSGTTPCF